MNKTLRLSSRQIRAARALLDWSQEDLAAKADLSIATIRKIETALITPREATLEKIKDVFESAEIEFLEPNGVRQRPIEISILEGHEGICAFYDDVYAYALTGGEIVVVSCNEDPFIEALGDYAAIHKDRMNDLYPGRAKVKCILTENYQYCPANYCEYRAISKAYIASVPFYIYGDSVALFIFETNPSPKIIVHHSALLADAYRQQFASMWDKATLISAATPLKAKT